MYEILFAFLLSVVYFASRMFHRSAEKHRSKLASFGAGTLIAIIFLQIFPEISRGYQTLGNTSFILLLLSFTLYYLIERQVYSRDVDKKRRVRELSEFHVVGFVLDNLIIGFFIFVIFQYTSTPYLLFIPFLLHVISSSVLLNQVTRKLSLNLVYYLVLSLVLTAGALIARYLYFSERELYMLLPFLTGFLLYFVVRDAMPQGREGRPGYFALGVGIVLAIILML